MVVTGLLAFHHRLHKFIYFTLGYISVIYINKLYLNTKNEWQFVVIVKMDDNLCLLFHFDNYGHIKICPYYCQRKAQNIRRSPPTLARYGQSWLNSAKFLKRGLLATPDKQRMNTLISVWRMNTLISVWQITANALRGTQDMQSHLIFYNLDLVDSVHANSLTVVLITKTYHNTPEEQIFQNLNFL